MTRPDYRFPRPQPYELIIYGQRPGEARKIETHDRERVFEALRREQERGQDAAVFLGDMRLSS